MSNYNALAERTLATFLAGCIRHSYIGTDGKTYKIGSVTRRNDGTIRGTIGRYVHKMDGTYFANCGKYVIAADGSWINRPPRFAGEL